MIQLVSFIKWKYADLRIDQGPHPIRGEATRRTSHRGDLNLSTNID